MPRKAKAVRDQQVYKLAEYGATVTIDYDTNNPPPFFQPASGAVIVGHHACQPAPMFRPAGEYTTEPPAERVLPGGNLMDVTDPRYQELQQQLANGGGRVAAPGATVSVLTSEDVFREIGVDIPEGQTLDPNVLAAASPQRS
jgi:hypothetical protein